MEAPQPIDPQYSTEDQDTGDTEAASSIVETLLPDSVPTKRSPALRFIILYAISATFPLTATVAVLAGLVIRYHVGYSHISDSAARFIPPNSQSTDSYYVDYSLSKLLLIASLMSTISMLLPGVVMAILSYILSRKWHLASQGSTKRATEIPTALQVAQLISILGSGSVSSLWKVAQYYLLSGRNRRGRTLSSLLKMAVYVLMIAITLGALTAAADTWLHKTSSTVLFIKQVTEDSQLKNYGRTAVPYCTANEIPTKTWAYREELGEKQLRVLKSINNHYLEPEPKIETIDDFMRDGIGTTLGISSRKIIEIFDTYAVAMPAKIERYVDYSASTHAIKTDCEVGYTICDVTLGITGVGSYELNCINYDNSFPIFNRTRFNATDSILLNKNTFMMMNDSSGTKEIENIGTVLNPFWFAYRDNGNARDSIHGWIMNTLYTKAAFQMPLYACNTSIYDAKYNSINGTITNFSAILAKETTSASIGYIAAETIEFWLATVQSLHTIGRFDAWSSMNVSALAGPTDIAFSTAFMGVNAAYMVSQPNLEE